MRESLTRGLTQLGLSPDAVPQLEAYALALGKVLEKDVSEKLLYFFHTNSTVKL